ncbi:hypothetical protein IWW36_000720 [Coemansia brasiliensis]|uniref:Cytokinin riboside 5'-monophosphate phosphoribohydrolase n=1 Tax=Coemansia brasiliensis TaxID=2650707 RepID=A0A9W8ID11_9FUNG|nr:hypothetical protein IWW36_000720 [Coemansia brasiliensis]
MGYVAQSVRDKGGKVIGFIIEELIRNQEAQIRYENDIVVKDNKACREAMNEHSAAFISLPGGFWTLEEILQAISWSQSSANPKPVVLVNTNGYYTPLKAFFDNGISTGIIDKSRKDPVIICDTPAEAVAAVKRIIG